MGSNKYSGAHKKIENIERKLKSSDQKDIESKPESLMEELRNSGEKYSEEDIIFIVRQQNGKIAWLEKGKRTAGLEHIIRRHSKQFQDIGIKENLIPELIKEAIVNGKIIGKQGNGPTPGDIYAVDFMEKKLIIMISISDNGFIVTAHPR